MGNTVSSTTPRTATAGIDSYVSELSDVHYEKSLGSGHFMKTIRCKHRDGLVVVKIFIKPDTGISLRDHVNRLKAERDLLLEVPNAFPYQRILETDRAAYLIRQHLYSNLYDRISTRPFLTVGEKKWIAFQLLAGLSDAHARQVCHGDIKTENVLVTSWNWAYLIDFSSFKPTHLPEDNPGDFSFFFDTSSRRVCYLAPERFYAPGEALFSDNDGQLRPSMDIFSLGCTIAELFLEGSPLFSLSQLLRYRSGEYHPLPELEKIEDIHVRSLVKHMIQLDPSKRSSAETYLANWRGKAFPDVFYSYLHRYIATVTELSMTNSGPSSPATISHPHPAPVLPASDAKIDLIYHDFAQISASFGALDTGALRESPEPVSGQLLPLSDNLRRHSDARLTSMLALSVNIPGYPCELGAIKRNPDAADGCLLFSTIICAALRNVFYPSSKIHALDLLLALSIHLSDDVRLDRIVPYIMSLVDDANSAVRSNAVKTVTQVLGMVESITAANGNIFPEYILPGLAGCATDADAFVRATYAQCIASIAESALMVLELAEVLKSETHPELEADGDPYQQMSYDSSLRDLQELIQEEVITLLIDPDPLVKRALLSEMPRLCIIFGRQKANDVLLSHMITYLNGTDWQLRSAFFESIVGVGTYVGGQSLEEYILPLMVQALTDAEEFVVEKVLSALTSLAELGLLQKPKLKDLAAIVLPLVCHPNTWIRYGAVSFVACVSRLLPQIDVRCVLYPMVKPHLDLDIAQLDEISLLESLKPPISRILYDQTLNYAAKAGIPWDKERGLSPSALRAAEGPAGGGQSSRPTESNELLQRLRTELGMTDEDKEKLFAMKYFISKFAHARRLRKQNADSKNQWAYPDDINAKSGLVALKNFGTTPHTLFLSPSAKRGNEMPSPFLQRPIDDSRMTRAASDSDVSQMTDPNMRSPSPAPIPQPALHAVHATGVGHRRGASETSIASYGAWQSDTHSPIPPRNATDSPILSSLRSISSVVAGGDAAVPLGMHRSSSAATLGSPIRRAAGPPPIRGAGPPQAGSPLVAIGEPPDHLRPQHFRRPSTASSMGTSVTADDMRNTASGRDADRLSLMTVNEHPVGVQSKRRDVASSNFAVDGRDMYLRVLLDKKTGEFFPPPIPGPKISLATVLGSANPQRQKRSRSSVQSPGTDLKTWRPEGILVAHLVEHSAAVNCIKIAADNLFFATCSDDKTVRIWDTMRLERNVTNRARLTYSGHDGKVKALTFCENMHSVASAAEDGSIHVCRVECVKTGTTTRYTGYRPVRTIKLDNDYAVLLDHYETETQSNLIYATAKGLVCGLDLRTMTQSWSLQCPPYFGQVTSMLLDRQRTYLVTGTHRGVFTIWDLRFGLRVKSFAHPSRRRIHRMQWWAGEASASTTTIAAAVEGNTNEISVWDITTGECKQVWCAVAGSTSGRNVEQEMHDVYGNGLQTVDPPTIDDFVGNDQQIGPRDMRSSMTVHAFVMPSDANIILTCGSDRKLRLLSTINLESSYVVVGMQQGEASPRYSSHTYGDIKFNFEFSPTHNYTVETPDPKSGSPARSSRRATPASTLPAVGSSSSSRTSSRSGSPSRNFVGHTHTGPASFLTGPSLTNHRDAITDMVLTQVPYPMIITVGRDGVLKVWK
ncbi:Serine/threonine-protein kinase [Geranomyces michiganensis]|nr:Serine/threonine-protein kinase [Geranomyces michiganensis]